jgi:GxxExxY protein
MKHHAEYLTTEIVDIACQIHIKFRPGLLESIYEKCFCYELGKREIPFQYQ